MKTFKCLTTFNYITNSGTITSPKTGRVLRLDSRSMKYLPSSVKTALRAGGVSGEALFTAQDLRYALEASEASRDEYKDGLNGDYDLPECIASEETDGECPHCEARTFGR
jgi:hypothetical protein